MFVGERRRHFQYGASALIGLCIGVLAAVDVYLGSGIDFEHLGLRLIAGFMYPVSFGVSLFLAVGFLGGIGLRKWGADWVILFFLIASVFPVPLFLGTLALLVAYWVVLVRAAGGERLEVVETPSYLFLLLFFGTSFVSVIPSALLVWVGTFARRTIQVAFFILIVTTVRTWAQVRRCLSYYFWAGTVAAMVGIVQVLVFMHMGVVLIPSEVVTYWMSPLGRIPRSTSLFGHPGWFGASMAGVGVLMLWLGLYGEAYYSRLKRSAMVIGVGVTFLAAFLSGTRGAWLAIVLAILLLPIVRKPAMTFQYLLLVLTMGITGQALGLNELILGKIRGLRPLAVDVRGYLADLAWEAIKESPWLGLGARGLEGFNNPFRLPAHNMVLDIASEMGVVAAVGIVVWVVSLVGRAVVWICRGSDREGIVLLKGALLSFLAMLIYDQFDVFFHLKSFWFHAALLEVTILICSGKGLTGTARPIFGR